MLYLTIGEFQNRYDGRFGLIDQDGRTVAPKIYEDCAFFRGWDGKPRGVVASRVDQETRQRHFTVYDLHGKVTAEIARDGLNWVEMTEDGTLAMVFFREVMADVIESSAGLLDPATGKYLIEPKPGQTITPARAGLAVIEQWGQTETESPDGGYPISPQSQALFDTKTGQRREIPAGIQLSLYDLAAGKLWLAQNEESYYGYVDESLRWVIPARYTWAEGFTDGTAIVAAGGGTLKQRQEAKENNSQALEPTDFQIIGTSGAALAEGFVSLDRRGPFFAFSRDGAAVGLTDGSGKEVFPADYSSIGFYQGEDGQRSLLALNRDDAPVRLLDESGKFLADLDGPYSLREPAIGSLVPLDVPGGGMALFDLNRKRSIPLPGAYYTISLLSGAEIFLQSEDGNPPLRYSLDGTARTQSPFDGCTPIPLLNCYPDAPSWVVRGDKQGYIGPDGAWLYVEPRWTDLED
jgi:hypothetical protein